MLHLNTGSYYIPFYSHPFTAISQVSRAREVYKMLHQYNIKGDAEVYTIAVSTGSQTGDLDFALSVYDDMTRNGVLPDEVTPLALYSAMLLCHRGA